jgi:hypothetical protein
MATAGSSPSARTCSRELSSELSVWYYPPWRDAILQVFPTKAWATRLITTITMNNSLDDDAKGRATQRLQERIAEESKTLPYRWGYFQGAVLIPWSLLIILSAVSDLTRPHHDPWYLIAIALSMGFLGFPLAFGLLRKRAFAPKLVYVMFGLSLLLAAIQIPIAIRHFAESGDRGSGFFQDELLLLWLLSMLYYRRRKLQFH